MEAAAKKIQKLAPTDEKLKKTVDKALKEFKEGASATAERHKHIRIADQSKYHWRTMEAYKSGGIADNKEDAKKLKQAEKSAEKGCSRKSRGPLQVQHWPKQNNLLHHRLCHFYGSQSSHCNTSLGQRQWEGHHLWLVVAGRPVGPCFHCGQLGHLMLHCPKLPRQQYPLQTISINSIMHVDNVYNNMLMVVVIQISMLLLQVLRVRVIIPKEISLQLIWILYVCLRVIWSTITWHYACRCQFGHQLAY